MSGGGGGMEGPNADARIERLELAMLELVTALGMLVSELSGRDDLGLSTVDEVERALDHGWTTLVHDARMTSELEAGRDAAAAPPYLYEVGEELAAVAATGGWAEDALRQAMAASEAAVGAVYRIVDGRAVLVASDGYPDEVMAHFRVLPLDADLPVAQVARTGRPLWFHERGQILEQYPHLASAHERTEQALGAPGVQGAVVPLTAAGEVTAVVLVGFTTQGDVEAAGRRAAEAIDEDAHRH